MLEFLEFLIIFDFGIFRIFKNVWQLLKLSTRSCNAPNPNLTRSLNLSLDSVLLLLLIFITTTIVCSSLDSRISVNVVQLTLVLILVEY